MSTTTEEEGLSVGVGLSQTDINWDRLDKTRFHVIGAVLFSVQSALLHPMAVVKTRIQVAEAGFAQKNSLLVFRSILRTDGIPGLFRGYGTSAIGSLPGRVLCLTALEKAKDSVTKSMADLPEATRTTLANAGAGLVSSLVAGFYFVPLDVVCQRLMVQGLPGMRRFNGAVDAVHKIYKIEGIRGLYRGFGMTVVSNSPASAIWWGAYGFAQHMIWRPSVMKTTRRLLKEDGWKGFYRGFGPRFLSMSLWGTSMIVTYELIKRLSVKDL
uniref:Solute carrier family 25 member 44 n=1 Tax=Araucaria cunninghamii TaxID=56994 RepID=A0A0D6R248_ARACU